MKPEWMKLLQPPTPKMMVLDNSLAIGPCTKSFVNSMGLQFLMFVFSQLNVINPRGLVDDVMTMECPEGLERGKNVGKKKRTRGPVGTFTLLVCVKKTFQQKIHLVIFWVPGAHGNCNPVN